MASDLECLQMEEKKFFPTDDKKVERSFLRRSVLKLKKRAEFISIRKNGRFQKSKFFIGEIRDRNTTFKISFF